MNEPAHILIIDDEESVRDSMGQVLRKEGYQVKEAVEGKTGLSLFSCETFEVVFLDLKLPGIKGMDVLSQIKEASPETPVVIITDMALTEKEEGKLIIRVEDTLLGTVRRIPIDMVVLATGLEPGLDQNQIAKIFNISCSQDPFFLERHSQLAPVSTFSEGIFLAGACQAPRDIPDTVAQADGTAAEALALADKGTFALEPVTAVIDEELCVGLWPFTAITYDKEKGISVINDALCQGCGTCVAACPSGVSKQKHFRDAQIFAEIEGIFVV
jgi:heterodisulfide reductase subunit A